MNDHINVIGAGLAGCEAAWQIAGFNIKVKLYEMKPKVFSPAHHFDGYAELVCSNSLKSESLDNAGGLLKEELRFLDSIIIKCADVTRVPAGGALAVDREKFSRSVTEAIKGNGNIEIITEEKQQIPEGGITVIATGPLTGGAFLNSISKLTGDNQLHFFDAAAPIITYESIDNELTFKAARYNKGTSDYINCPMSRQAYDVFYNELVNAELAEVKDFDREALFEGCMPLESMAKRGRDTLRFGPLKPVGLIDPATGREPHAVVQLRQDNSEGTLFNIVGFQTRLKWTEQKRVFSLIPGLKNAEFVRFGVMHRNTFINSPKLLNPIYNLRANPDIFFAGQITGVEGYIESASSGLVAGINAARHFLGMDGLIFPSVTAIGALSNYVSDPGKKYFQPINANFGIFPKTDYKVKSKLEKHIKLSERALDNIRQISLLINKP